MTTRRTFLKNASVGTLASTLALAARRTSRGAGGSRRPASGPLRRCPGNPRYFADASGKPVYLCGSHVWNNLVDMGPADPPPRFDFQAYLRFLETYGHNFIRLWRWEHFAWDTTANGKWGKAKPHVVAPHPWPRTGPGKARDGHPKFDLARFDADYFRRLRARVAAAGKRGVYVSVMLFEGWAMQRMKDAWLSHPFHPDNNVNQVGASIGRRGDGLEIHTLEHPEITRIQEAYVRHVIDTVGELDNVLYEISNENHPASTDWQYHMIRYVKSFESKRAWQHPVGMTFQFRGGSNETLFDSPADWVSPNPAGGYRGDPPANDGRKVILNDTDHLWGIGGNHAWVWKSFVRGLNPIFMDPYDGTVLGPRFAPQWEPLRRSMGHTRRLAEELDLTSLTPQDHLASTSYCLAAPGKAYVVYLPQGNRVTVDLSAAHGKLAATWIDPKTGKRSGGGMVAPGRREFRAPGDGDQVLLVRSS